jgi:ribose transport system ATP-binding protein
MTTRLNIKGLCKSYNVPVLKGVDLNIQPGEIYGLIGENGAGKSTLINLLCGLASIDEGEVLLDGKAFCASGVKDAMQKGVSVALQELSLIDELNIAENVCLRQLPKRGLGINQGDIHQRTRKLMAKFGMAHLDSHQKVASLSLAQKQMIEFCKAVSEPASVLILDEPTASLSKEQSDLLHQHMHELASKGLSILYVSHRLQDVLGHCSTVSVLRDGLLVKTTPAEACDAQQLIQWMSKGALSPSLKRAKVSEREVLQVEDCTSRALTHPISFTLRKGEILGLAGLAGAGRTELLELVYGLTPMHSGAVYRLLENDQRVEVKDAAHAVSLHIGMLSEDRKQQGIFAQQSLAFNASIAKLSRVLKGPSISFKALNNKVSEVFSNLTVKHDSYEQNIEELSGGNQQKVLLGRWLFADTQIFLLDEPTRGVDVATKALMYQKLEELKAQGASAIVASSEIEELFTVCDRIIVMSEKQISGHLNRDEFDNEKVLSLAFANTSFINTSLEHS